MTALILAAALSAAEAPFLREGIFARASMGVEQATVQLRLPVPDGDNTFGPSRTLAAFDLRLGWSPCGWLAVGAFGRHSVGTLLQSSAGSEVSMRPLVFGGFASVHPIPSMGLHVDALLGFARVALNREGHAGSVTGAAVGGALGWLTRFEPGASAGIAINALWSPSVSGRPPSYVYRDRDWSGSAYQVGLQVELQR